jgi:hypothetical protein
MSNPNCGRDVPQYSDDEIQAQIASYPEVSADFGPLRDIQFPYWHACQAIAACLDVASMLRADLDERGDTDENGGPADSMVAVMTRDGAGGWRTGNSETIGFDAAWTANRTEGYAIADALETLAGALDEAWTAVVDQNRIRGENRANHDAWAEFQLAHPGIER